MYSDALDCSSRSCRFVAQLSAQFPGSGTEDYADMLFYSSIDHMLGAGFDIVDYDVESQEFVVERGSQRMMVRARNNQGAILSDLA
jgi:hypothetical protein